MKIKSESEFNEWLNKPDEMTFKQRKYFLFLLHESDFILMTDVDNIHKNQCEILTDFLLGEGKLQQDNTEIKKQYIESVLKYSPNKFENIELADNELIERLNMIADLTGIFRITTKIIPKEHAKKIEKFLCLYCELEAKDYLGVYFRIF